MDEEEAHEQEIDMEHRVYECIALVGSGRHGQPAMASLIFTDIQRDPHAFPRSIELRGVCDTRVGKGYPWERRRHPSSRIGDKEGGGAWQARIL